MKNSEFSHEMDVIYENINKGGAVGLDEYEKSVILTNAQEKLVYELSSTGDLSLLAALVRNVKVPSSITDTIVANKGVGLETALPPSPSATGDIYVSSDTFKLFTATDSATWDDGVLLIKGVYVTDSTTNNLYYFDGVILTVVGVDVFPAASAKFDPNGTIFSIITPYVRILSENVTGDNKNLTIFPITLQQHSIFTSKPYRFPKRRTVWRIMQGYSTTSVESGGPGNTVKSNNVELVGPHGVILSDYTAQLLLQPQPIILESLEGTGLTIRGLEYESSTNMLTSLHPAILDYAVTLAEKYYFDKYNAGKSQAQ